MRPATMVYRDPDLPHQLVLGYQWGLTGTAITVSCNCRRAPGTRGVYEPFAVAERWEPGDVLKVYQAHLPAAVTV